MVPSQRYLFPRASHYVAGAHTRRNAVYYDERVVALTQPACAAHIRNVVSTALQLVSPAWNDERGLDMMFYDILNGVGALWLAVAVVVDSLPSLADNQVGTQLPATPTSHFCRARLGFRQSLQRLVGDELRGDVLLLFSGHSVGLYHHHHGQATRDQRGGGGGNKKLRRPLKGIFTRDRTQMTSMMEVGDMNTHQR